MVFRITYPVLLMHRRTDLWGPDALEFDPDRFLDDRLHKYLIPNPFIFLPFNAGPRICLGQQVCILVMVALLELSVTRGLFVGSLHTTRCRSY